MSAPRYAVFLKPAVERALKKLAPLNLRRIAKVIDAVGANPRPPGATAAFQGEPGLLRIRVGDCRVIYTVHDGVLTVLVITVGHRRDVYQRR